MMSGRLRDEVAEAFAPQGWLVAAWEGFRPRASQTEMAQAVAQTLTSGGALVVEAGTGVGKTFAYLVPALLSGERVLVSTATKALQDQLYSRDIPRLLAALGLPRRVALLKGRSNYLCPHRLPQARQNLSHDRRAVHWIAKVEDWSRSTRTGDLSEVTGLDEKSPLWPYLTSTRDNCLGATCPSYKVCPLQWARREAMAADLVVINHHLFFADLAVRESGMAELLPSVRVVIFDEAHQLNEIGVQFLGHQLGHGQLLDLTRDALGVGLQSARGLVDWQGLCQALEYAVREWRLLAGRNPRQTRLRWREQTPEGMDPEAWPAALVRMDQALLALDEGLAMVSELAPDFVRLSERVAELRAQVQRFNQAPPPGQVRWLEVSPSHVRCLQAPLNIAETMSSHWSLSPTPEGCAAPEATPAPEVGAPSEAPPEPEIPAPDGAVLDRPEGLGRPRAWVFTSATLGDAKGLDWFTQPTGLTGARCLRVPSPFDYPKQAALFVPPHLPRPNDPGHTPAVAALVAQAIEVLGGRTLVLTTTLRAMQAIGEHLKRVFDPASVEVLIQGEWPKHYLMARFRRLEADTPGCVLVATASFWEGFDVPGDALQLVVIDKLPFPPPNDPVVEARCEQFEAQGLGAFNHYFVPEATIALQQGAGRLIRTEQDRGVLMVCDPRLNQTGYGRQLLASLPPMQRLPDQAALMAYLAQLRAPDSLA